MAQVLFSLSDRRADTSRVEGQQLRYCGIGEGYDDIIIQGSPDEMKVWRFTIFAAGNMYHSADVRAVV